MVSFSDLSKAMLIIYSKGYTFILESVSGDLCFVVDGKTLHNSQEIVSFANAL